jgi:nitrile hydratase
MNGIHDMGGMHGMGPIPVDENGGVFHAPWEGRLFAMRRAAGAWRRWNIDAMRHAIEQVPPAQYLQASYYARHYLAFVEILLSSGLVTREELASGRPAAGQPKLTPPLTASLIPEMVAKGFPATRGAPVAPRMRVGQRVRTRNIQPVGPTRLPRYARGKSGTVIRDYGVFVFPDTNAQVLGEKPQHLYCVRFSARELWGDQADAGDCVHLDLWDDYFEPG